MLEKQNLDERSRHVDPDWATVYDCGGVVLGCSIQINEAAANSVLLGLMKQNVLLENKKRRMNFIKKLKLWRNSFKCVLSHQHELWCSLQNISYEHHRLLCWRWTSLFDVATGGWVHCSAVWSVFIISWVFLCNVRCEGASSHHLKAVWKQGERCIEHLLVYNVVAISTRCRKLLGHHLNVSCYSFGTC